MTSSFSFNLKISLNKKIDLNLKPIKDLVSKDAFNAILKEVLKGIVGDLLSGAAVGLLMGLQDDLFSIIPEVINFGNSDSFLNYKYSGINEKIWFTPIKEKSLYYSGFSIGCNLNVFYNDQNMWDSIAKNFSIDGFSKTIGNLSLLGISYTLKFYEFWKSILENLIMRSYNFSNRFTITNYEEKIGDNNSFNPNYYYQNLTVEDNSKNLKSEELNLMFSVNNEKNHTKDTKQILWKKIKENENHNVETKSLILSDENRKNLSQKMYVVNNKNNSEFNSLNYNYDFNFDPILNFTIPFQMIVKANIFGTKYNIDLKIDLNISEYISTTYFPVNFYDTTNKKLVTSMSKKYSNFNVKTEQKKS